MLNKVKNVVVIATLLAVGYGAHVVLNKPVDSEKLQLDDTGEWAVPTVEIGEAESLRPAVSLGTGESLAPVDAVSPASLDAPVAMDSPLPPIGSPDASQLPGSDSNPAVATAGPAPAAAQPQALADAAESPIAANVEPPDGRESGAADMAAGTSSESHADKRAAELAALAQTVQQQLDSGQFAQALAGLSKWYSNPTSREDQKVQLHPLLDQLTGTVIYSRRHLLEPPYTVQENETLDQIAQRYQVPKILLAKINGIPSPYDLLPGETVKVVRGPFRAETSLSRRELTLFLGPNYAGRFSVRLGSDLSSQEGLLEVVEKLDQRAFFDPSNRTEIAAGSPDNPYGRYWIGLREISGAADNSLGIHGIGEGCSPDDARGCIGLEPRDAEDLYSILSIGSTVRIIR